MRNKNIDRLACCYAGLIKKKKKKRNQDRIVCMGVYSSSDQLQDKKRDFSEKWPIKKV